LNLNFISWVVLILTLAASEVTEMSGYLTREMTGTVLQDLVQFEEGLAGYFKNNGLDLREDLGRRNALVSSAQESFFAKALAVRYENVTRDGRPGQPDIIVGEFDRELECKMTSGSGGSWNLQTDYVTLTKKGQLDFLYVLASPEFDSFAVLFFDGLTPGDFYPPSPGARQKARMNKSVAMDKCTVLWGDATCRNEAFIDRLTNERDELLGDMDFNLRTLDNSVSQLQKNGTAAQVATAERMRDRETDRLSRKMDQVSERIRHWSEVENQWSFKLMSVG
jgi:hypothetical protein